MNTREKVVNQIISELENGVAPWNKPWFFYRYISII